MLYQLSYSRDGQENDGRLEDNAAPLTTGAWQNQSPDCAENANFSASAPESSKTEKPIDGLLEACTSPCMATASAAQDAVCALVRLAALEAGHPIAPLCDAEIGGAA